MSDPDPVPGPPWRSRIDAVLWWHLPGPAARAVVPLAVGRGRPLVTLGGLVAYRSGPVGPYDEVLGAPVVLRGALPLAHVPFMAVDSAASVAGGRRNWALPKVEARFAPGPGGRVEVDGPGWTLALTVAARPRRVPAWGRLACAQVRPDGSVGRFAVRVRGTAALASVVVEHLAPSALSAWLRPGRHRAVLVSGVQDVAAPTG